MIQTQRRKRQRVRKQDVAEWLETFATCVRGEDYDQAETLFDPQVTAFGTRTIAMEGLETLVTQQWRHVWGVTSGFAFDPAATTIGVDRNSAWAIALWTSRRRNIPGPAGRRAGRATFIFRRERGRLLAIHSHLSMNP